MRIWDLNADCICDNQIEIIDLDTGETIDILVPPQARTIKAGLMQPEDFSGTPQLAVVVFITPFANLNYAITFGGVDSRLLTYEDKAVDGFTINANSYDALTGEVSWTATTTGETS